MEFMARCTPPSNRHLFIRPQATRRIGPTGLTESHPTQSSYARLILLAAVSSCPPTTSSLLGRRTGLPRWNSLPKRCEDAMKMFCYLRYPGRELGADEMPPVALVSIIP